MYHLCKFRYPPSTFPGVPPNPNIRCEISKSLHNSALYSYSIIMQHLGAGSMHRCQMGASATARCQRTAVSVSTASARPHIRYVSAPSALLPAARWSCGPHTQHAEHTANESNSRFHLHRAQAGISEPDTPANEERDEESPSASDDSFWSNRSVPVSGPNMPFGLILGLASVGALETAYLTVVSCSSMKSYVW